MNTFCHWKQTTPALLWLQLKIHHIRSQLQSTRPWVRMKWLYSKRREQPPRCSCHSTLMNRQFPQGLVFTNCVQFRVQAELRFDTEWQHWQCLYSVGVLYNTLIAFTLAISQMGFNNRNVHIPHIQQQQGKTNLQWNMLCTWPTGKIPPKKEHASILNWMSGEKKKIELFQTKKTVAHSARLDIVVL